MSKIKIVAVRCGEPAKIEEMDKGLKAMQAFVGGLIECVALTGSPSGDGVDLWCNEEGLFTCQPNRLVVVNGRRIPIHGDFFIAGHDAEGETVGLTDEEAEHWCQRTADWATALPL